MKLHHELLDLRKKEKQLGSQIIEKLQLMEGTKAYRKLGHPSLFDYLVRGLGYSESAAYQKQSCVRLSKEIPEIKEKIDSGALTSSGLSMAYKNLKKKKTTFEKKELLQKIENQPTREIKKILTQEEEAPPVKIQRTTYRDKVIVRLELSHEQNEKLERLKALKSHSGELAVLLETMIDRELQKYEAQKGLRWKNKGSQSPRYIPRVLRNRVIQEADYKCQYPGCEATHYLQVDHIHPVYRGGQAGRGNLQVLCAAHNQMKG